MEVRPAMEPIAYSKEGAAAACGVHPKTIQRAISTGQLPAKYPTPRKPIILHPDLLAWVQRAPDEPAW